jgi:hypothetical protein
MKLINSIIFALVFGLLLALATPSYATIAFVASASNGGAGSTDLTVTLPTASMQAKDFIIFIYTIADADNSDLDVVCNTGGYTEISDLFGDGTEDANLGVYWKFWDGVETTVVGEGSTGGTDTSLAGIVLVFRGVALVSDGGPFDTTETEATGTTTGDADPPSIDWTGSGTVIVIAGAAAHIAGTSSFTAPTGYTVNAVTRAGTNDTADATAAGAYRLNPADPENPGAFDHAAAATGWAAVTMALKDEPRVATVTHCVSLSNGADQDTYTTGNCDPDPSDLLLLFALVTGSTDAGDVSDSLSGTWANITSTLCCGAGGNTAYLFVRNQLSDGSVLTVTMDVTGDGGTGANVVVLRIAGMTRTGSSAVRQFTVEPDITASGVPNPTFSASALIDNPTLGMFGTLTNPATATEPIGWTEGADIGHDTPGAGLEYVFRHSGFTGTAITWESSEVNYADIIVELDTTELSAVTNPGWVGAGWQE